MATIQERRTAEGRVHYRALVRVRGCPVQTATFERKTDAKRWAAQLEGALLEGRRFPTREEKRRTLAELIDRYCQEVLPGKKGEVKLSAMLGWWRAELGTLALVDVTASRLAACRDKLLHGTTCRKAKRSPATSPIAKVRRPREARGRVRILTEDERARLLDACKSSRAKQLYPLVLLALSTGARQGEILWLRWPQIHLDRRVILLDETKTESGGPYRSRASASTS